MRGARRFPLPPRHPAGGRTAWRPAPRRSRIALRERTRHRAEAAWEIRWFTPLVETNLCGHATLATAHTLRRERGTDGALRFRSRYSGILTAHTQADGSITLDFPAAPGTQAPVPEGLSEALGERPEATFRTGALRDLLTVLPDEATVRAVTRGLPINKSSISVGITGEWGRARRSRRVVVPWSR
ncbi:PhzF family phenazine biosynthesis protein [Streptomyces sp. SM13]|uniref:PhzF family phenazine biosynthesis protein n=1 Tax=Streptomyces sp. SM13 TaxID=1983803 RepID=UPI000CD4D664|nr:PhzF family phenazine biosynthesis protein [Streptomyces sp. SM13]